MFKKKSIFNIKNNTLILIEGDDKFKFIQGIISNDIEILKKKKINLCLDSNSSGKISIRFFYNLFG